MPLDAEQSHSVFNPAWQHTNPDAKIIAAIERLGQVFRVLLWDSVKGASTGHALSPVQIQALIFLLFHDEQLARVGELAREFMLTPATVSDAISALERKGLVEKVRSQHDRRAFVLRLTDAGKHVAHDLADWAAPITVVLKEVAPSDKVIVLRVLLNLIARLQNQGVVQTTRMCLTCRYFGEDVHPDTETPHHCRLLDQALAVGDLRIDCPEHEPKA